MIKLDFARGHIAHDKQEIKNLFIQFIFHH
jgi:hypothetical protein